MSKGRRIYLRNDEAKLLWWKMQGCLAESPGPHDTETDEHIEAANKMYQRLQQKLDWWEKDEKKAKATP